MVTGQCHLCDQMAALQDSHVWSKFAYKRYAADQTKGGRFADLFKMELTNKQYTAFWFCEDCEKKFGESAAGILCQRIDEKPNATQPYDEKFLRFATSISWRTLKLHYEDKANAAIERLWKGAKQWKRYLRGTTGGINPYTQHVFVISDNIHGFDKMLGGMLVEAQSLVLSQIGPLLIVGHLKPENLSSGEKTIWRRSQIMSTGGSITPIRRWEAGRGDLESQNITIPFAYLLGVHQAVVIKKVASGDWSGLAAPSN
jgi:hypothetical protein